MEKKKETVAIKQVKQSSKEDALKCIFLIIYSSADFEELHKEVAAVG